MAGVLSRFIVYYCYALKNSVINFYFCFCDRPLCTRSLVFSSEKCPSMAFVVLGIPMSIWSREVNRYGRFRFKLRYADLSGLCE